MVSKNSCHFLLIIFKQSISFKICVFVGRLPGLLRLSSIGDLAARRMWAQQRQVPDQVCVMSGLSFISFCFVSFVFNHVVCLLFGWLTDPWTLQLLATDPLTNRPSKWLTDWLTDRLTGCLTDWLWQTDCLTHWVSEWLTDWQASLSEWLTDWLTGWLSDWPTMPIPVNLINADRETKEETLFSVNYFTNHFLRVV